jgi:hypothetical protein
MRRSSTHAHRTLIACVVALGAASFTASPVRADEPTPTVDHPSPPDDAAAHAIDRTWVYADDARVAAPMQVIAGSNATYTAEGASPTRIDSPYRALAGNTAQPGVMGSLGGEVGLLPHLSLAASGQMGLAGEAPGPTFGALAGLRVSLLPTSLTSTHLVLSAGYLREAWAPTEPGGDSGAWAQLAVAQDIQRLRLAATVHGEHVFAGGRDPVDVMVQLGASYRITGPWRAGVEYVGQDVEEAFVADAEGGARHFIGPTTSLQLMHDRLTIVAGPALGLSPYSPSFIGRFGMAYGF